MFLIFKEFACNGTVVEHPEYGEVIQLQGDQRQNISKFLKQVGLAREDQIKVIAALVARFILKFSVISLAISFSNNYAQMFVSYYLNNFYYYTCLF